MTDTKRTRTAAVIVAMLLLLLLPACGRPKLRESLVVSPEDLNGICGLTPTSEVTRSDAICIAGLAGLNLDPSALTVRMSGESTGIDHDIETSDSMFMNFAPSATASTYETSTRTRIESVAFLGTVTCA